MIYNVTKGHIMQELALYNRETGQTTYSYNWIGESNIPQLVVNDDDCKLLKFGAYSAYKAQGVITNDATELYVKDESDKTDRQAKLRNMSATYQNLKNTVKDLNLFIFAVMPKDKILANQDNNDISSLCYVLDEKRTLVTNIDKTIQDNVTQTLVSENIYGVTYDTNVKKYKIFGNPPLGRYKGRTGQVICANTALYGGIWYDFRDKNTYPKMYQYYKKIENVFNNNNSQAVAVSSKLINYRMYAQCVNVNVEKRIRNMTSFFDSNDCVAMKEVINLYNDLLTSSSETERNYAKTDIDKCYIVTWLAKCFEKGDIIDDKVNFDDRIDYYARIDNNETIIIDWVNKAVDSGQLEITEKSIIKIKFMIRTQHEGVQELEYSAPYSFGNMQYSLDDIKKEFSVGLIPPDTKMLLRGFFDYGDGTLVERNILYCDISLKDSVILDYGEFKDNENYSDTINIGEPPADDDPTEPTDDPTDDDPIDGGDVTTKNGLTTTYALTSANANSLGSFIWNNNNNWFDNLLKVQADALSNIVSCKLLPFSLSGTGKVIKIGNISTQVTALEIDKQIIRKSGGSLKLRRYFNNFLDYAPYTKISLYLPFIGFSQIENEYMYDGVTIEYLFDIITGEMLVLLKSKGKTFRSINGSFGIDIPFSSTNKAQIEGSFLSKIAKDVIDVNPIGLLDTYTDIATSRFKTSNSSSPSSVCSYSAPLQSFVTVDRPILNKPSSYNHDVGQKCVGSYYLRNLKGYTEVENIELNCPCTDSEKNEILSLLRSGVYL